MALQLSDLKAHCNITGNGDDTQLQRMLAAATAHVERLLGFKLEAEFPPTEDQPPVSTVPADLEMAVLQLAADWYENREASLVGVAITAIPFGVREIVAEYRRYSFGIPCVEDDDGE